MLWTAALFAVSQANQGLGLNAADTLFFLRFGVEFLPTLILISGPVVMIGILGFAVGLGRFGSRRWLPLAFLVPAGLVTVERVGITADVPGIYPIVWLVGQTVMMVSLTAMWAAAGEVCTTRQAKRLYPLFASAGIAGGVVGNAATGPLARFLGTENLLLVQAGLLVAAAWLALTIGRRFFSGDAEPSHESVVADFRAGLSVTRGSRLLRTVAWVGVALGILLFMVVFPFSQAVTFSFPAEEDVASYLGFFSAGATGITFLVSLFLTNRLFARLGVVATLLIVPLVYMGGFALWLAWFTLATATLIRGFQFVVLNAIAGTAWTSLFNVLPGRRRGQVMAFMTAGPMQLGTMLSGALLLAGALLAQQARFAVGLAVAAVAAGLVWRMRGYYREALVEAVGRGLVDVFAPPTAGIQKPPLDADAFEAMSLCLNDPRPAARAMAVSSLLRLEDEETDELITKALQDDELRVRKAAVEVLAADGGALRQHMDNLLADPAPEIRKRTLELLWREAPHPPSPPIEAALEDAHPSVRAMAAVVVGGDRARVMVGSLLASPKAEDVVAGLHAIRLRSELAGTDLTSFLDHSDRRVRAEAAQVLASKTEAASLVVALLDDPSVVVREAAAQALAATDEGVARLLQVIETGSVRATDAALPALARAGKGGAGLAAWASKEIDRASYLKRHRIALEASPDLSMAGRFLLRLLAVREERLERWVVTALTTPDRAELMSTVVRGMWSDHPETRSQAMEALDSLKEGGVARKLLGLLEEEESPPGDARLSLRQLTSDFDDWIRALAYRSLQDELVGDVMRLAEAASQDQSALVRMALSRWDLSVMHQTETLDVMERVLALQQVRLFSDIDPEDLGRIAQIAAEYRYEAEEAIYRQGEEGDEMLVIVNGEVVVSREQDGVSSVIRTYGVGEHVGELALLRGQPRASDVTAGPEGVHALALRGPELKAILEERPEVAMAMLGTLAERLATM